MSRRIVGIVLVHNEDLYVEQAIRNAAAFCDRIHVADHMSTDDTWEIVDRLARELDSVDALRIRRVSESHALVAGYAATDTWIFGVDGDELYDPAGLACLREDLIRGAHRTVFRIVGNALHCVELDRGREVASGHLGPPSRLVTKLYNFAAIESWTDCYQRLHGGKIVFRPGFDAHRIENLATFSTWQQSPLRCLHVCFLRRSSSEPKEGVLRPNPTELGIDRRTSFGGLERLVRSALGRGPSSDWKRQKYRLGDRVERDATPFFRTAQLRA